MTIDMCMRMVVNTKKKYTEWLYLELWVEDKSSMLKVRFVSVVIIMGFVAQYGVLKV